MFYAFGVNVVGLFLLNSAIRQAKMLAFAKAVRFAGNRDKYEEFAEIPVLLRFVPCYLRSVGRNRAPRTVRAAWLWTILPRLRLGYCFVAAGKYARSCARSFLLSRGLVSAPSINRRTCVPDHRFVESYTCVGQSAGRDTT